MIRVLPWSACALLMLSGCSSGPAPRTFVLNAPLGRLTPPADPAGGATVQVQSVVLPDYLDTEDILLREGAHGLVASPGGRWGERLSAGMTHALTAALVTRLPDLRVEPARPTDRRARQILVDVDAFDVGRDGRCELSASWTILPVDAGSVAVSGHEVFTTAAVNTSAAGDAAVVAAMAATVDKLADALARDLAGPTVAITLPADLPGGPPGYRAPASGTH
jgi:uncharacterized lipoprotein YmbA